MTISQKISDFVTALEKRGHSVGLYEASCILQATQHRGQDLVLTGSALIHHIRDNFDTIVSFESNSSGMWEDRSLRIVEALSKGVDGLKWFGRGEAVGIPESLRIMSGYGFHEGSLRENAKNSDFCRLLVLMLDGECGEDAQIAAREMVFRIPGMTEDGKDYIISPKAREMMAYSFMLLGPMARLALRQIGRRVPPQDAVSSFPLTLSCWQRSEAKLLAKVLREEAASRGFPMTASQSLEILAEISGKKDWNRMSAGLCKD